MTEKEPTELVSCGRCNSVNSVPFGLDRFQCYSCGVSVVISRESSAACAAASPTALYLDNLQAPKEAKEGKSSQSAPSKKQEASSRGFFEKLTRQVDKTLQKVEQSLFADPPAGQAPAKASPALPVGQPLDEGKQNVSPGREAKPRSPAAGGYEASQGVPPKAAPSMQAAPNTERLRAAEERAARAEQLLEAAVAREAVSASERLTLRKQLDEAEQLVSGLSQQLDSVQKEVSEQRERCQALEKQLQEARAAPAEGEGQDVAVELMQRIAQLEAALRKDGAGFDASAQAVR